MTNIIYYCNKTKNDVVDSTYIEKIVGLPLTEAHEDFKLYEDEDDKKFSNVCEDKEPSDRTNCTLAVLKFMGLIDNKTFSFWSTRSHKCLHQIKDLTKEKIGKLKLTNSEKFGKLTDDEKFKLCTNKCSGETCELFDEGVDREKEKEFFISKLKQISEEKGKSIRPFSTLRPMFRDPICINIRDETAVRNEARNLTKVYGKKYETRYVTKIKEEDGETRDDWGDIHTLFESLQTNLQPNTIYYAEYSVSEPIENEDGGSSNDGDESDEEEQVDDYNLSLIHI